MGRAHRRRSPSPRVTRPLGRARTRRCEVGTSPMVLPLGDLAKTRIVPLATYVLIALNVVTYLYQLENGKSFTVSYAATPYEISHNVDIPWIEDGAAVVPAGDDG